MIGTIVLVMAMLLAGCATEQSSSDDTKVESTTTTTIDSASNVVTVKFSGNGGVGTMDDLTADKDTGATLPANTFTKTGYAFSHWTDAVSGQEYADGAAITDMSDDIALTAQWTVKHYVISLSNDGDVSGDAAVNAVYDCVLPALQVIP